MVEKGVFQGIGGFIAVRGEGEGLKVGLREPAMGLCDIPETGIIVENLMLGEDRLLLSPEGVKRGLAGLMNAYNGQWIGAGMLAIGVHCAAPDRPVVVVLVDDALT